MGLCFPAFLRPLPLYPAPLPPPRSPLRRSYGVFIWELLMRQHPWAGRTPTAIVRLKIEGTPLPAPVPTPAALPGQGAASSSQAGGGAAASAAAAPAAWVHPDWAVLVDLYERCTAPAPVDRPTFEKILALLGEKKEAGEAGMPKPAGDSSAQAPVASSAADR